MSASKKESPTQTIDRLTKERDMLKLTLAGIQGSVTAEAQLREALTEKETVIVGLNKKLDALRSDFDILQINQLAAATAPLEEAAQQLRANLSEKTAELANLLEREQTQSHQITSLQAEISALKQNVTPIEKQVALETTTAQNGEYLALIEKLKALETENAKLQKASVEHANLNEAHIRLTTDFNALTVREKSLLEYVEKWRVRGETWKQESKELNTTVENYQRQIQKNNEDLTNLTAEYHQLSTDFEGLTVQNKEYETSINEWQVAVEDWQQENEQLKSELQQMNTEVESLTAQNNEYSATVAQLDEDLENLEQENAVLHERTSSLENQLQVLIDENSNLKNHMNTLSVQNKENLTLGNEGTIVEEKLQHDTALPHAQIETLQKLADQQSKRIQDLETELDTLQRSVTERAQKDSELNVYCGLQTGMQQRQTEALNAIQRLRDELPQIRGNKKRAVLEIILCLEQGLRASNAQDYFDSQRTHLKNQLYTLQFTSKSLLNTMLNVVLSIAAFCGAGIILSLTGNLQKNQEKYGSALAFNLFGLVGAKQRAQGNIQAVVNALDVVYRP